MEFLIENPDGMHTLYTYTLLHIYFQKLITLHEYSWEAEKSHEGDKGGVDRIYFAFDSCDVCLSDFWFEHTSLNILFRN